MLTKKTFHFVLFLAFFCISYWLIHKLLATVATSLLSVGIVYQIILGILTWIGFTFLFAMVGYSTKLFMKNMPYPLLKFATKWSVRLFAIWFSGEFIFSTWNVFDTSQSNHLVSALTAISASSFILLLAFMGVSSMNKQVANNPYNR